MQEKTRKKFFLSDVITSELVSLTCLLTGYFSSVANVLRSSPKISYVTKRDFSEQKVFARDQWIW